MSSLQEAVKQIKEDKTKEKSWFPLESNPQVMTNYVRQIGLNVDLVEFVDIFSTEEWALEMVPRPCLGTLMVFPLKPVFEEYRKNESEKIEKDGQEVSSNTWYCKQYVGNACGTIGLLHAVANARDNDSLEIKKDSWLDRFMNRTKSKSAEEIGRMLEEDDELEEQHVSAAATGQSAIIEETQSHFTCFSCVDGSLYEFDGRKKFAINHGPTSKDTLLEDACKVMRKFMDLDPEEVRFTMVALVAKPPSQEV